MMKVLRTLLANGRGAVTIELALAAPLLATLLVGLIDLSTAYSNKLRMEQIAQRTIERVQAVGFSTSFEAALEAEAIAAATAAGMTGATAELTWWLQCDGTKMSSYTATCTGTQAPSRYAQLDIQYTFAPILVHRFSSSNADGTLTVHGTAGIRIQ